MKQQINLNAISRQVLDNYNRNNIDPIEIFIDLTKNIDKYYDSKDNIFDEYYLIKILKSTLGIASLKKVNLNKYLPSFIEI